MLHHRAKIRQVNAILKESYSRLYRFTYIEPADDLCGPDGRLNENLYFKDGLHIVDADN